MTQSSIEKAAAFLSRARLAGTPVYALPDEIRPADLDQAYEIQKALRPLLDAGGFGPCVGYKIGCTTLVMQDYLGIPHPCAGSLYRERVADTGVRLSLDRYRKVGVELEIAVRLASDLPRREQSYSRDEAVAAVESCHPSIELVDDRYEDWRSLGTPTLVADDFFSTGCVLGRPAPADRSNDLAGEHCTLLRDGEITGTGYGRDILGDPLHALLWLADNAPAPEGLKAGQVVTLGSVAKTLWIEGPCRIEGHYGSLGALAVEFVP